MSEEAYKVLKRNSRGGACVLRLNDMNLAGVTWSRLNILGIVSLALSLSRNTPLFKADFYVTSDFALPSDGLLGLRTLRSQGLDVYPHSHSFPYCGRHLVAMEQARRLANLPPFRPRSSNRSSGRVTEEGNISGPFYPMPLIQLSEHEEQANDLWKEAKAIVVWYNEIQARSAKRIPIWVLDAVVGNNVCLNGFSCIQHLGVESTLSTVREGHVTDALVVNTTGGAVKIKHELLLVKCLAYNQNVVPEHLDFLTASVSSVCTSSADTELGQTPTLRSVVSVVDYPEIYWFGTATQLRFPENP